MADQQSKKANLKLSFISNNLLRGLIKRLHFSITRRYYRFRYLDCGCYVDFGYRFRFSRKAPFRGTIGAHAFIEEFNVWNAKNGNITVGTNSLFGLHNIIMGPIEIGDDFSSGPHVSILGPRHAVFGYDFDKNAGTVIGNSVWISTGAIIFSGVTIGDGAVIGPGAVVTKDVPGGAFMLGNPARDMSKAFQFNPEMRGQKQKA